MPQYFVGARTRGFTHYYRAASRADADVLARAAATHAPGRVWIEGELSASGRKRSPEAVAAQLEETDARFVLDPTERLRRDAARRLADPAQWQEIVTSRVKGPIIGSYARGELRSLDEGLRLVDRISIGCYPQGRTQVLGTFAYLAQRTPPAEHQTQLRGFASCVRTVTAEVVLLLKAETPDAPVSPKYSDKSGPGESPTSELIDRAIETLRMLGWFGDQVPPSPATVDRWVRERRKTVGEGLPSGRPPRAKT